MNKTHYYRLGIFSVDNKDDAINLAEKGGISRIDWVEVRDCEPDRGDRVAEGIIAKDEDEWSIYKEYYRKNKPDISRAQW